MNIKQLILAVVAVVSLVMTPQLYAKQHQNGMHGCHCMVKHMMKNMNLTPEQRQKMKSMKESMRSSMMSDMDQMKAMRQQMQTLIISDKMDEAAMDDLISKKTAMMAKGMKRRMTMENQMYQMLTPEQKTKYKNKIDKMMKNGTLCSCKK